MSFRLSRRQWALNDAAIKHDQGVAGKRDRPVEPDTGWSAHWLVVALVARVWVNETADVDNHRAPG